MPLGKLAKYIQGLNGFMHCSTSFTFKNLFWNHSQKHSQIYTDEDVHDRSVYVSKSCSLINYP